MKTLFFLIIILPPLFFSLFVNIFIGYDSAELTFSRGFSYSVFLVKEERHGFYPSLEQSLICNSDDFDIDGPKKEYGQCIVAKAGKDKLCTLYHFFLIDCYVLVLPEKLYRNIWIRSNIDSVVANPCLFFSALDASFWPFWKAMSCQNGEEGRSFALIVQVAPIEKEIHEKYRSLAKRIVYHPSWLTFEIGEG